MHVFFLRFFKQKVHCFGHEISSKSLIWRPTINAQRFDNFVDPDTEAPLHLVDPIVEDGRITEGRLVASADDRSFPVRKCIPRFVSSDNYASNFGLQWNLHAKTQLDSHTGASYSRDRLFATTHWPRKMRGQRILEAGSGAGRFTEILVATGAEIYSFDFSEAVDANFATNGSARNLQLFQASIYSIPFAKRSFDKVLCLGVLQHTPDVKRSFMCLAEMVKPGGQLVVDCYPRIWRAMLHWKYVLRPMTTRISPNNLYRFVQWYAPKLRPLARFMRSIGGRIGHRLVPILDQSDKAVPPELQHSWTILDTYDALSATFDSPQTVNTVRSWYEEAGFRHIGVRLEGIVVGRGVMSP